MTEHDDFKLYGFLSALAALVALIVVVFGLVVGIHFVLKYW